MNTAHTPRPNTRPEPEPQVERIELVCRHITRFNQIALGLLIASLGWYVYAVLRELMQ